LRKVTEAGVDEMGEYDEIRLEKGGVVVCYFAPNFQITPLDANDLTPFVLPRGAGTKAKDLLKWKSEITIQGEFENSDGLPNDHGTALETLFGKSPVSAQDQVNRIRNFARTQAGTYELYVGEIEYTASNPGDVDIEDGIYPKVFITEIRPPRMAGLSRVAYMVKFLEGFEI